MPSATATIFQRRFLGSGAPPPAPVAATSRWRPRCRRGYFIAVDHISRLGTNATVEAIVQELARLSESGVAFVLFSAAYCLLFSDAIAHEAYRRLMISGRRPQLHKLKSYQIVSGAWSENFSPL